jgi:hypothetical protein
MIFLMVSPLKAQQLGFEQRDGTPRMNLEAGELFWW